MRAEAAARQQYSEAKEQLDRFESMFGPAATMSAEAQQLKQLIAEKEAAVQAMALKAKQDEAVCTPPPPQLVICSRLIDIMSGYECFVHRSRSPVSCLGSS